ncbi:MAG: Na+/H+ antiporter subunit E [Candidatus Omnitrophica bacterium]|nr:Na+/H+ antiporter subunit E [Candidatus Omnitrophota bacterium]
MSIKPQTLSVAFSLILLIILWWLLAGDDPASWYIGVPAIILGVAVKRLLPDVPAAGWQPVQLLPFTLYFLQQSVLSGWDVIKRTFNPRLPLAPGLLTYTPRVAGAFARVFFANAISLLPGTLSADFDGPDLIVHVLDENSANTDSLRTLEGRVAALFGEVI